jgi:hypothetical protein
MRETLGPLTKETLAKTGKDIDPSHYFGSIPEKLSAQEVDHRVEEECPKAITNSLKAAKEILR